MLPFVTSVAVSGIVQFLALKLVRTIENTLKLDLFMGDLPYRVFYESNVF
jgi:hypothetical protein